MVDLFGHMNELLKLFSRHLTENNFTHFAKLETTEPSVMKMKMYNNIIVSLDNKFCRFADFQQLSEKFYTVSSPLTFDTENAPSIYS